MATNPSYRKVDITTDHPEETTGSFWPFSAADWKFTACMFLITVMVDQEFGRIWALGGPVAWYIWMRQYKNGRTYYTIGQAIACAWIDHVRKGSIADTSAKRSWLRNSSPKIPFSVLSVGWLGMLQYAGAKLQAIVIAGDGSDIASQNPVAQNSKLGELADWANQLAGIMDGSFGLSYLFRRRPFDATKIAQYYADNLQPAIIDNKDLDKAESSLTPDQLRIRRLRENAIQIRDLFTSKCVETDEAAVLTVRRGRDFKNAVKRKSITRKGFNSSIANKAVDVAVPGLKTWGVSNPGALDRVGMRSFVRGAWDISPGDYHIKRMRGETQAGNDRSHWPSQTLRVGNDYSQIDEDNFHRVIRIDKVRGDLTPWDARKIFAAPVLWLTVALVGEAIDYEGEYGRKERSNEISDWARKKVGHDADDPRSKKRREAEKDRLATILDAGYTHDYLLLACISATSLDALDAETDKMMTFINSIPRMKASVIEGSCRQLPAFWSATTGIKML